MAKNQNKTNLQSATSSFSARYLELSSAFAGKGFWGKLTVSFLMVLALLAFALEGTFMLLSSFFSVVFALMGDKTTDEASKAVRQNGFKSYKRVVNGRMARNGINNATRAFASSIGSKLDLELHDGLSSLTARATLRRYFKLLKIKDKPALVLVKSSSCGKLLDQYNRTHGSVMKLEQTINAAKVVKKANKKKAKKQLTIVNSVHSWNANGQTVVSPLL